MWLEAAVLNNTALDDLLFQIIINNGDFFFTFFVSFSCKYKKIYNQILLIPLVIYLWSKTRGDGTEGLAYFSSSPPRISACTVYTRVLRLWMQTWSLAPLLSSYMILNKFFNSSMKEKWA